jgi:hypothetical protein
MSEGLKIMEQPRIEDGKPHQSNQQRVQHMLASGGNYD